MTEVKKGFSTMLAFTKKLPVATLIIAAFWVFVLITGVVAAGFSASNLLSDVIQRFGMWGLLVLAMVPAIQSGTGPNFALPIGVCLGLFSMVTALELGFTSYGFILASAGLAIVTGCVIGYLYGILMNAVKGSEMAIATYTGFAATFFFCILWLILPYNNPNITWFIGGGLRNFIQIGEFGANRILDNILMFNVFGVEIPTGTLLIVFGCCILIWLFFRSKAGIAISAGGMNPMFARASGLNVDRSRIFANMISTTLGALGIILYYQSFGFIALYDSPLQMAFPAVAAILVGGASAQRSKVVHVIIGTFLFQAMITNGPPVFTFLLQGADMSDAVRMVVQNGIILYALTQMKGGAK